MQVKLHPDCRHLRRLAIPDCEDILFLLRLEAFLTLADLLDHGLVIQLVQVDQGRSCVRQSELHSWSDRPFANFGIIHFEHPVLMTGNTMTNCAL